MNYNDIKILKILGFLQIFSLCLCDIITGTLGITTLIYINKASKEQEEEKRSNNIRVAKTVNIIGWVILVLSIVIEFIVNVLKFIIK